MTRILRQSEQAMCGLACIAFIMEHHKRGGDIYALKQKFPHSTTGVTLSSLVLMASELGFAARPLRLELEGLIEIVKPAILHWDFNHFVVLTKVHRQKYEIYDPAYGLRVLDHETLSNHFTGVAVEFQPLADYKPMQGTPKLKIFQLWSGAIGLKRSLFQVFLLSLVMQALLLAAPIFFQIAIDNAVPRADLEFLSMLAVAFCGIIVAQSVSEALRSWVILNVGQNLVFQTVGNLVNHLTRLPMTFFERRHLGDIMSRIESIEPIRRALTEIVISAIIDSALALFTLALMFVYNWRMASVALVTSTLYVVFATLVFPLLRRRKEDALVASAIEQTHLFETVQSARAVKLFVREQERVASWQNLYAKLVNSNLAAGRIEIGFSAGGTLIFGMQTILIIYLGAWGVISGSLTIGMLFAFFAYQQNFAARIKALIQQGTDFRLIGLHLQRIADIVYEEAEPAGVGAGGDIDDADHVITFTQVAFRYGFNLAPVFEGVSFSIQPGEFVALVGPSGAGKTTIMKLLLGLQYPTDGKILINNIALHQFGVRRWRRKSAVIMQDDILMTGTLAENIAFFDPDIDMEKVRRAASDALIHEEIEALPMGYLTNVSAGSAPLSGGQIQRILLARAFYKDPSILIMDEGTANLDEQTESLIAEAIAQKNITRIAIAHRPALIDRAQTVYELNGGVLQKIRSTLPERNSKPELSSAVKSLSQKRQKNN